MTITIPMLAALAGIAGFILAYMKFGYDRRITEKEAEVKEGVHRREHEQLKTDLAEANAKIVDLMVKVQRNEVDSAEIKTDVKHILAALNDLTRKIDERAC
jgi:5-bromo-4-chloroindolyl phosphate hydrolysis protein